MYTATLLARIESELLANAPIAHHVDLIAGTSTGGIIAIALGLKQSACKIEHLYLDEGRHIFPVFWTRYPWLRSMRQSLFPLYDHGVLEMLLYQMFGDATLGESHARLAIPSFLGPQTQVAVLKTDHHPDFKNDYRMFAWEAARATSAAPTYFSGHAGHDYIFLDGGIWANNPIMVGVVEALSTYQLGLDQIDVLSIGTGNPPYKVSRYAIRGGLFSWREVIRGAIFLTTDNAQAQATLLLGPDRITRLEPEGGAAAIELDDWAEAAALLPKQAHNHFFQRKEQLHSFFQGRAVPRERFYT